MHSPLVLTLSDSVAEAVVVPALGAGLSTYDLIVGGRRPLFRPCRSLVEAQPFDLACNLLVPWSNRISGGGFRFGGRFYALQPNVAGEPCPIHGDGFSSVWTVEASARDSATLSLSSAPGPFRYSASVTYKLESGALSVDLAVANRGAEPLPFGLGIHPWFVRRRVTHLAAEARRLVLETPEHLPAGEVEVSTCPEWDFASPRPLPSGWINNAFRGWNGRASVLWPDHALALDIEAGPQLGVYLVYSPSAEADFFCFEPVTHSVDAHNLPGGAEANGLRPLAPGERLSVRCRFTPRTLAP